jgi:hypothetical protein
MKAQALCDATQSAYMSSKKTMETNPTNSIAIALREKAKAYQSYKTIKSILEDSMWSMVQGSILVDALKYNVKEFKDLFTESADPADQKKKPEKKAAKKTMQAINGEADATGVNVPFGVMASNYLSTDRQKKRGRQTFHHPPWQDMSLLKLSKQVGVEPSASAPVQPVVFAKGYLYSRRKEERPAIAIYFTVNNTSNQKM